MPIIRQPRSPRPSDDVRGPNAPMTSDPGFDDPLRNPAGDVGSVRDYAGKRRDKLPSPYGYPTDPRR